MMDDLISRQAAIEALHDEIVRRRTDEDTCDDGALDEFDTEAILKQLPAVRPELKKGKWKMEWHWLFHREVPICSQCLRASIFKSDFCPNCGADMREEKTDETN